MIFSRKKNEVDFVPERMQKIISSNPVKGKHFKIEEVL